MEVGMNIVIKYKNKYIKGYKIDLDAIVEENDEIVIDVNDECHKIKILRNKQEVYRDEPN